MKKLLCSLCGLLVAGVSVQAQVLAKWTFETSVPSSGPGAGVATPNYSPEVGTGSAFGWHAGASIYTSPAGNGSAHSFSSTNWGVGDYYQFSTSTLGYSGIEISYDQTSSNTGPGRGKLQYSTDGTSFTDFSLEYTILANASPNTPWSTTTYNSAFTFSYDLSAISVLNNAATVYFRVVDTSTTSANGSTVAFAGSERIDNFTVAVIPEPSCAALAGVGLLLAFGRFRRRK